MVEVEVYGDFLERWFLADPSTSRRCVTQIIPCSRLKGSGFRVQG